MGLVHVPEHAHVAHEPVRRVFVLERAQRGGGDGVGQASADLVLLAKDANERLVCVRSLEAREDLLLLVLLVVVLDEPPHDVRRARERVGREILTGLEAQRARVVDEEDAPQNAVLAHQVFDGQDLARFSEDFALAGAEHERARRDRTEPEQLSSFGVHRSMGKQATVLAAARVLLALLRAIDRVSAARVRGPNGRDRPRRGIA